MIWTKGADKQRRYIERLLLNERIDEKYRNYVENFAEHKALTL